ncbi:MAG: serine--tRNA ligase [Nitrospinae bacterium]|nr:serine--tRNA ligase [Nitrospinota bacterium]
MLDIKLIKKDREAAEAALNRRGQQFDLAPVVALEDRRVAMQGELDALRAKQNEASAKIGQMVRDKKDPGPAKEESKRVGEEIKEREAAFRAVETELENALLAIPNIPDAAVPLGKDETENVVVREWGTPRVFDFTPKNHQELGEALGILDLKRAAKITGARFSLLRGQGAKLERCLMSFMLNQHAANGYEEVLPPFIVNAKSMTGTGQLPKFADDLFKIEGEEHYLIPTAEVPVTNIHAGEILAAEELTKKFCAYTPCFRREAGTYGKVTAGIIRQHQFNKVEIVKLAKPEDSWAELETLTNDAEMILQKLDLPYRVIALCTGDMGFSAAKTYDIEVWLPSMNRYVEISSCSNFTDFQARRANIKFKRDAKAKPEYVHTLNGSGLAIGRTMVAILENYQTPEGNVRLPKALRHFMGTGIIRPHGSPEIEEPPLDI